MQLKIYRCLPYLLIYTDDMDANSNGQANGPVVRIRRGKEGDEGLKQHEICHVHQWWRTLSLHSLLYLVSKRYRLRAEVEAYRKQLEYPNPRYTQDQLRELYADWLSAPGGESLDSEFIGSWESVAGYVYGTLTVNANGHARRIASGNGGYYK